MGGQPASVIPTADSIAPPSAAGTLQAYLGHKSISNTVRYTELSPTRFKDIWR